MTPVSDPAKLHSSLVGGSSAARVLGCPGSVPLVQSFLSRRSSGAAEEGTALHLAIEHVIAHDLLPSAVTGKTFHNHEITGELVEECLQPCYDHFLKMVGPREFELEVNAPFPGIDGAFGTADVVYFHDDGRVAGIMDWKFGSGHKVEAHDNAQMMFYLLSQLKRPDVPAPEPDCVYAATICQPRLNHFDTAHYTLRQLESFARKLRKALKRTEVVRGPYCYFCIAKPICPEFWGRKAERLKRGLAAAPTTR
jgi:Protein of unknown function (DUF2800)